MSALRHLLRSALRIGMLGLLGSAALPWGASATPITLSYTGGLQTYTVSSSGVYDIVAYGAQGGTSGAGTAGGLGGESGGDVTLTSGTTLTVLVGGQGSTGGPGGGGGGTFVVEGTGSYTPLIIAGGGGGSLGNGAGAAGGGGNTAAGAGTNGGGSAGSGGGGGGASSGGGAGGGGYSGNGTSTAYGGGGKSFLNGGAGGAGSGTQGFLGNGGNGGAGGYGGGGGGANSSFGGGGGGGGYSGGGGGGSNGSDGVGGGGGGYINTGLVSNTVGVSGTHSGNGEVLITFESPSYSLATASVSPGSVALGATRVGNASPSQALTVTNTGTAGSAESLDAWVGSVTSGITASGSISLLTAGSSNNTSITVGLDTSTAGAKSGTVAISLASDGSGTSGNGTTALASQTVSVSGSVYAPAVPSVPSSLGFGIVHVGSSATQTLSIGNTASGLLTDTLLATGPTSSGAFTASGSASVAAGSSSNGISYTLNTTTAGSYAGSSTVTLASHDSALSDLSRGTAAVALSGTVNNYAVATFGNASGYATLTGSGNAYTLNFGTVNYGTGTLSEILAVLNGATGPADLLSGLFSEGGSGFDLTGFNAFSDLVAQQASGDLGISINTDQSGNFIETIDLQSTGSNDSGYSGALADPLLLVEILSPSNQAKTRSTG